MHTIGVIRTRGAACRLPLFASRITRRVARICLAIPAVTIAITILLSLPGAAAETVHLAVALPMSGPQQSLGAAIKAAIELALADRAAKEGVGAALVELSWHDDACTTQGGLAVARAIASDSAARPLAVLGHACPSASQAAAPIYDAAGIAFLNAGSLPSRMQPSPNYGSRTFTLPGHTPAGVLIAEALTKTGTDARIALVRDRTQLATQALQAIAARLQAVGRPASFFETFAGGDKDFSGLAVRLRDAKITHMAIAAFPSEAALLVAQVRAVNPDLSIVATDQLADAAFIQGNVDTANGVRVASVADYQTYPSAVEMLRRLGPHSAAAGRSAIANYVAIEVILAAAEIDKAQSVSDMRAVLRSNKFESLLGPINFDVTGSANLPSHVLHVWHDGKLIVVPP